MEESKSLQTVSFQDTEIEIYELGGQRMAAMSQMAIALGYSDPHNFFRLIDRNEDEFVGKQGVVKLTTPGGVQEIRVINYHGVIRAGFLAKTKKAKDFRDWAEDVLFKVMTQGAYLSPEITLEQMQQIVVMVLEMAYEKGGFSTLAAMQEAVHRDIGTLHQFMKDNPGNDEWIIPRIKLIWDSYAANYGEPKLGVTVLTEDWMGQLYVGQKWSKDAMMEVFPRQLRTTADWNKWLKKCDLKNRKALPITENDGKRMYRDYKQYGMRISSLVRRYMYYSRDSIQKKLKEIETHIDEELAANHVYHVERFNKKSYADYRATEQWDNKKYVMTAPEGPYDQCWDCHRPISHSTVHLHHMLYERVGFEIQADFRPLCAACHGARHPDKVAKAAVQNRGKAITVPMVTILEERERALRFSTPDGSEYWIPKRCSLSESEVKHAGDTGSIVITYSMALEKGLVAPATSN